MPNSVISPRPGLPRPVDVTALREAVRSERSWRGVMRELGFTGSRTGRVLREVCDEFGIEYTHFRVIGPDDASLASVVPAAGSWSEALGQLGYSPDSGSARATVRKHCQRLGIDTSHLRLPRVAAPASHELFAPRRDHLRAAGPYLVAAALTLAGHTVNWAAEGAVYDLVADLRGVGLRRVQVKTGTQRTTAGWIVTLKRTEHSLGGHRRACYSSEDVDYFGCVDGDGQIYLVPIAAVEGRTAISMRRYEAFRLRQLHSVDPAESSHSAKVSCPW